MLKRMPFERPTEHYDERIYKIDEQICVMLKLRKQLSNKNPGFPPFEYISKWAETFELYEDFLKVVFGTLRSEEHYKPMVDPSDFRKHIPVLKSVEKGNFFYTLNSIKQYNNASVVTFNIDWDEFEVPSFANNHHHFELQIGEEYDCRMLKGGGHSGHAFTNYVVSPPIPDKTPGLELTFIEYFKPFSEKETGTKIVFSLE
ncbi:hypothetical protein [Paenibacillus sp. Z3-2]